MIEEHARVFWDFDQDAWAIECRACGKLARTAHQDTYLMTNSTIKAVLDTQAARHNQATHKEGQFMVEPARPAPPSLYTTSATTPPVYWMVYVPASGHGPQKQHKSFESARAEARRLSLAGAPTVHVLQHVGTYTHSEPVWQLASVWEPTP